MRFINIQRLKNVLWMKIVSVFKNSKLYPFLYISFLHSKLNLGNYKKNTIANFFAAAPNKGAGIGHQMANWIAGYWFARQFNLKFAHIPFSNSSWEAFLGFGENEETVDELVNSQGYKKIRIPLFDEYNNREVELIKKIIYSYQSQKVVFVTEQDQFYKNQYGNIDELKKKFYSAKSRKDDQLIYSKENFNIAIHVRRGDINIGQLNHNPNLLLRWQDNEYFTKVLENVIENINPSKPIKIFLFSQGDKSDFSDFEKFENIEYCLDMSAKDSFLHMVYADLLITSKSSFSYKPALLSKGIKVVPNNFWHGYPHQRDWIVADEIGNFNLHSCD
jgi:hypothetical protein